MRANSNFGNNVGSTPVIAACVPVGASAVNLGALLPEDVQCVEIIARAAPANSGVIHYGYADTVTADTAITGGMPLEAGDSVTLLVRNTSKVWLVATAGGQFLHVDVKI